MTSTKKGRRVELRNALWTAWLRRRPTGAALCTARLTAAALRRGEPRALLDSARGLRWVLRERRPVPPAVEQAARALEGVPRVGARGRTQTPRWRPATRPSGSGAG